MPLVRLTQKLQKEIGITPASLSARSESSTPFEEWYAHLFFMDRKKYVIFVERQTLFSFVVGNVQRKDIRERLPELYEKGLGRALFNEGVSGGIMSTVLGRCRGELEFAKTESRRTIGALNEFVKQHKFAYYYHEGARRSETQDCMNRQMPMHGFPDGSTKHKFPMDVFAEILAKQWGLDYEPQRHNFFNLAT